MQVWSEYVYFVRLMVNFAQSHLARFSHLGKLIFLPDSLSLIKAMLFLRQKVPLSFYKKAYEYWKEIEFDWRMWECDHVIFRVVLGHKLRLAWAGTCPQIEPKTLSGIYISICRLPLSRVFYR